MPRLKLFMIESVNPVDLLDNRFEGKAIKDICKMIGHDVGYLKALSYADLEKNCDFIANIDLSKIGSDPICIHLAAHGNAEGLNYGVDFVNWNHLRYALAKVTQRLSRKRHPFFISISACGAGYQELTRELEDEYREYKDFKPPMHIFVTEGSGDSTSTKWPDSAVSWALFYLRLEQLGRVTAKDLESILDDIKQATNTTLSSFSWNFRRDRYHRTTGIENGTFADYDGIL